MLETLGMLGLKVFNNLKEKDDCEPRNCGKEAELWFLFGLIQFHWAVFIF